MINVLLICSLGASTGALCAKIKSAADAENYDINIWATALAQAGDEMPKADVILLGPQVRFMQKKIQAEAKDTPVQSIDMRVYAAMDGVAVFNTIKEMAADIL